MVSEHRSYAAAVVTGSESGDEGTARRTTKTETPAAHPGSNMPPRTDDFEDPLYIHITENANLILVSPPLSEVNYASWSRSMRIALEIKNKFGLVDGTVPDPGVSSPRYVMWRRCNNIVCSWILKSVSPTIAESIMYLEKAEEIWNKLRNRYSQSDPHKIAGLQNEIFKKCSRIQKEREDDHVIRFLEGLNDEFETIKSGVLVMDPIPDMEKVLNMALKLERKLKGSVNQKMPEMIQSNAVQNSHMQSQISEQNVLAFSASNNKKKFNSNGGKNIPKCIFCGMTGHTIDKCYKKHGYPPGWVAGYKSKNKQFGDTQQGSNASVNQVGDIGLSPEQFQRLLIALQNQNQGDQPSTSAAVILNSSGMKADFKNSSEGQDEGMFLSNFHVNVVLNSSNAWILDSGATNHITCSLDYFETCHEVHGITVKLPNEEIVAVTHIGDIKLCLNMMLKYVLYIPCFNLHSISSLPVN